MGDNDSFESIDTFRRPIICIDATHLNARTRGILLVAVCKDGNEMIYPLTFGFAKSEYTKSWTWFLKKLHKLIQYPDRVLLVSDRNNDAHIKEMTDTAQQCEIHLIHFNKFKVDDKWKELDDLPCSHAIAVARFKGVSINSLVFDLYITGFLKHAYEMGVNPVPNLEFWDIPDAIQNRIVLSWEKKNLPGRPKKLRIPSVGEKRNLHSCSKCGKKGHKKNNCPESSSITNKPAKRARSCNICKKDGHNRLKCPDKPPEPILIDMDEQKAGGPPVI
ncbi:hypothetical protein Ddye_028563 [Dipteronia dyeriana]|uniref:CCHC-type domain-containing protein n=1 Tax=Dipteronia dyeriana TaxID=168575 RepID=A0AAD9TDK9_9ROSI|nr:hypothetical protein Ddye_028563 [Dipteronia dyeriana]